MTPAEVSAASYYEPHGDHLSVSVDRRGSYARPSIKFEAEIAFKTFLRRWYTESQYLSSPDAIARLTPHRQIVTLGETIIPLLVSELRRRPSFLFLALEELTGQDPVPEQAYGNMSAMTGAWLDWWTNYTRV